MIIVWPFNGLCNRIRAISSAIELGKRSNRRVVVIWHSSPECGCRFDDIFEENKDVYRVIELSGFLAKPKCTRLIRMFLKLAKFKLFDQSLVERHIADQSFWIGAAEEAHILINTHSDFFDKDASLESFKPKKHLLEEVEKLNCKNKIGIHIRGQDNQKAREVSKISIFERLIDEHLSNSASQGFFLATDEPELESRLLQMYPANMTTHEKRSRSRSERTGIQDATIDLYALAQCNEVIGSHWSSFSEIAARLGNIELGIANEASLLKTNERILN